MSASGDIPWNEWQCWPLGEAPDAPHDGTPIEVKTKSGRVFTVRWADGGGEETPRHQGWFTPVRNEAGDLLYNQEVFGIVAWRRLEPPTTSLSC